MGVCCTIQLSNIDYLLLCTFIKPKWQNILNFEHTIMYGLYSCDKVVDCNIFYL